MTHGNRTSIQRLLADLGDGARSVESINLLNLSDIPDDEWPQFEAGWLALPAERRHAVMVRLGEIAEDNFQVDFEPVARLAIDDEDAGVRAAAIRNLWESEDQTLIAPLLARLAKDADAQVRAAAASTLGHFVYLGEVEAIPARFARRVEDGLLEAIRGPDEVEVRRRAVEAIGFASRPEVPGIIRQAYEDADEAMRLSAVFAMGRSLDAEAWGETITRELENPNPAFRFQAARAAGELELRSAVPALASLINDADAEVQEAAIWALGQIGGEAARAALHRRLGGARGEMLRNIEAALENADFADLQDEWLLLNIDDQDDEA